MTTTPTSRPTRLQLQGLFLTFLILAARPASGAEGPTGSLEGRVFSTASGEYLEKARVTIEGTGLETFTNNVGQYYFPRVPAGSVSVKAFFTGLKLQTESVTIAPGQSAVRDLNLAGLAGEGPVTLSKFVVSTSREMTGAAIAVNEQRFAPNIKNVVAADEFGPVADNGVGEILKFLPGVAVEYNAGNPRGVSLNGVPSDYVPLTVNGFDLASAQNNRPVQRTVDLMLVSTNNLSRMEVLHSPTPESPGMALGGSVNMVVRNAFERSKPALNASVYFFMPDNETHFRKTPGPRSERTFKTYPGADFSLVMPVNQRFGFTLSANLSRQYQHAEVTQYMWRGAGAPANGGTLPDTTPDRPYLSDFTIRDLPKDTTRRTFGGTIDYKLSSRDRMSLSLQYVRVTELFSSADLNFNVTRVLPTEFGPTFTHGFAGAGQMTIAYAAPERVSTSFMPTLIYRHDGPVWKAEAGAGYSRSEALIRDFSKGYFNLAMIRRTGVTVSFDDIHEGRPGSITVTDAAGRPVNPYDITNYVIQNADGGANEDDITIDTYDMKRSAYANVGRDFIGAVPITLKAGLDIRQSGRDHRTWRNAYNFVGRDNVASTSPIAAGSDDGARIILDEGMSERETGLGFPKFQRPSTTDLYQLFQTNPGYFTTNEETNYRTQVNVSKVGDEVISAAFLRADVELFNHRLKLIGGLRAEQTNVSAEGPLTDPAGNYQRDSSGRVILGSNGRPLPITTNALAALKLTLVDRGQHTEKEYLRYFPSINAAFKVRENLVARAAYYHSIGRPSLNQYAGGLMLPDPESGTTSGRITVNNAGIKPWTARSVKLALEYYFEGVGLFSVGGFRRDFDNFFDATLIPATPEFLAFYGLDPNVYGSYEVSTQQNLQTGVRMEGLDISYKQALTFLPRWARGVQIFANGSTLRTMGEESANFAGFVPRTASWGVSLNRERYNLRVHVNYRSRARLAEFTGRSIPAGTFNWNRSQMFIDINGEYRLTRSLGLFWNIRNVNNQPYDMERAGSDTPEYARLNIRSQFNALWTAGVKASF